MIKGVSNSLIGSIFLTFDAKKDFLILCGGDSELIGNLLKLKKSQYTIEPNLVMLGMILFSQIKKYRTVI